MTECENSARPITILSELLLGAEPGNEIAIAKCGNSGCHYLAYIASTFTEQDWNELHSLAGMHHVIMRAFPRLQSLLGGQGHSDYAQWVAEALQKEQARIQHALFMLEPLCLALQDAGSVIVMKSLDHWPDLGSDLDLFTDAKPSSIIRIMRSRFGAEVLKRSWGDRMAHKWNFAVPGLPELVEVHFGRLGQMGEQGLIGESLIARALPLKLGPHRFRVPAPEDRIVISTLQRMFRHFYLRLCDIVEIARMVEQDLVDFDYLHSLASLTGLWEGVATYLKIVSGYVKQYRGSGLPLPPWVSAAAQFGNEQVRFRKNFLRIPIVPHSARLYATELKTLFTSGEIRNTLRLSLLPALATAAALKEKVTDSDSGIW